MRRERITITIRHDILKKLDSIIDGQKIRNRSNAIETVVAEKFKHQTLHTAVILAGGNQTNRIKTEKGYVPKVLLPIGDETLIEKNINLLASFGIEEILISEDKTVHGEIREVVGDGSRFGVNVSYFDKEDGTASVLRDASEQLDSTFIMINGDVYLETVDIAEMFLTHKNSRAKGTLAIATSPDPSKLGSIHIKGNMITDFFEKETDPSKNSHLINAGIYILEPSVCDNLPKGKIMVEKDLFPRLAKDKKLSGYTIGRNWVHLHDETAYQEYLSRLA